MSEKITAITPQMMNAKVTPIKEVEKGVQQSEFQKLKKQKPIALDEKERREQRVSEQAKEFEALLLSQMIKTMEKPMVQGFMGGNSGMAGMLFSSVMGQAMSESGGLGLRDQIADSLLELDGANISARNEMILQTKRDAFRMLNTEAGAMKISQF